MKILGLARVVLLMALGQRNTHHTVMGASMDKEMVQTFMEDSLNSDTGILPDYQDHVKGNSFENELEPEVENIVVDGIEEGFKQTVENAVDDAIEEVHMCLKDQKNNTNSDRCDSDFYEIAGKCYYFGELQCQRPDCRTFCQLNFDADLATLGESDLTDPDPLMKYIYDNGDTIGLHGNSHYYVGAKWNNDLDMYMWEANERELSLDSYLWYEYEYTHYHDCVVILQDNASFKKRPALVDFSCDVLLYFICEKDLN